MNPVLVFFIFFMHQIVNFPHCAAAATLYVLKLGYFLVGGSKFKEGFLEKLQGHLGKNMGRSWQNIASTCD